MEFDLNNSVPEEKIGFCNGDCEKGSGCVQCFSSSSSSCSSNSSSSPGNSSVYSELWHACAGPLASLPRKGNLVVYFPQGHLEQIASSSPFSAMEMPSFDLQPQIFCKVVNVLLLANKENDEVYTQVTLLPQPELVGLNLEGKEVDELGLDEEGGGDSPRKSTPHMFCKTLTASDTSTHGGFSVPRRAAEDCFPPLDYKQQRPSQELVAKDLHGVEWKFRHIYRGQPRRHLLTTGWSIFVSQKNLVAGDAVLFLRGEDGELRLGIRRALRPRNGLPDSVVEKRSSFPNVLSPVANAIFTKSAFHVFYSPRASHADFVIPYQKFINSVRNPVCIGARFKMRLEIDDSPERRCSGVVAGVRDLDPYRWPNSKWRCLMVRWDEEGVGARQDRISPWEIDPSVSLPILGIQSSPRLKKLRPGLQAAPPDNPNPVESGRFLDFEDSVVRSSKVLQGQENVGFVSPFFGYDTMNRPLDSEMQPQNQNLPLVGTQKASINELMRTHSHSTIFPGFAESNRFQKVLQGQEICPLRSLTQTADLNLGSWGKPNAGSSSINVHPTPNPSFLPLASEGLPSMFFPYYRPGQGSMVSSYASTFPRSNVALNASSVETRPIGNVVTSPNQLNQQPKPSEGIPPPAFRGNPRNQPEGCFKDNIDGCKLFGFSLTGDVPATNSQNSGKRSCTKVHKQGSLVGRAIDLSRLNGYNDLITELERLFGMERLLRDPDQGWRVLYTDSENDVMVVGDDPWHEFCNVVSKIHVHTLEEVEKMTIGGGSDDTHESCLDQAPAIMEASKSSSVGEPDSSPTVIRM